RAYKHYRDIDDQPNPFRDIVKTVETHLSRIGTPLMQHHFRKPPTPLGGWGGWGVTATHTYMFSPAYQHSNARNILKT
ncbi:MAG: hypothetical protein QXH17_00275, partial [Candidatus Bathyarchaeia archaeon]